MKLTLCSVCIRLYAALFCKAASGEELSSSVFHVQPKVDKAGRQAGRQDKVDSAWVWDAKHILLHELTAVHHGILVLQPYARLIPLKLFAYVFTCVAGGWMVQSQRV